MDISFLAWWLGGTTLLFILETVYRKHRWGLLLTANARLEAGDFEGALSAAEEAATKFPKDWRPLVTAAAAHTRLDDPAAAQRCCEKAKTLVPHEPFELLLNQAVASALLSEPDQALEAINRAISKIEMHPLHKMTVPHKMALLSRAFILGLQYKYSEALNDCNEAMKVKADIECYVRRCWVYLCLNDLERAKLDCEWIMQNLPGSQPAVVSLALSAKAIVSFVEGKFDLAIEEQTSAIELDRQNIFAFINRGYFLSATKQLDRALLDLEHADELTKSGYGRAHVASNKARVALMQKRLEDAIRLAETAVSYCERPEILCTRAAAYLQIGELDKAARDLNTANRLDPLYAETYWFKGQLLELQGNETEAKETKQKALDWHYKPYY